MNERLPTFLILIGMAYAAMLAGLLIMTWSPKSDPFGLTQEPAANAPSQPLQT